MHVEVEVSQGKLRGHARGRHLAFLGVPYARPPVGALRFKAPEPPQAWSGVRDALEFGNVAPQDLGSVAPFKASGPESEDCLYLNVYTPATDARRRPVLFWIHGGGFNHGSGSQPSYNGGPLAERGDVVVVSINYRLGALGYLYLGGHGGERWGAANNAGQLDQIAALRWVRDNIAAFGGDPAQVTIFGESAGSVAVCSLLAMPAARGLFTKAVAQSGTANRAHSTASAAELTARILGELGLNDKHADQSQLQSAPLASLLSAQAKHGGLSPVVDGRTLPQRPLAAVREGSAREIPLLVGTTRDETRLFGALPRPPIDDARLEQQVRELLPRAAAERAGELVAVYRASRAQRQLPSENSDIADAVLTASRFRIPATRLCEAQVLHQPKTFLYQFDWESPARGGQLRACHGLEIPFVWGIIGANSTTNFSGTGEAAERLAEQMMDAWIAFAKCGDPSHPGIGTWPAYDSGTRHTMLFGMRCEVSPAPFEEERAIWERLLGPA